jgi:osmotically-inducible protein OsmY
MKSTILLIVTLLAFSPVCFSQHADSVAVSASKSLRSAQYKSVQVSVRGDAVFLTGSVSLYANRREAEEQVRRVRGVRSVRDAIIVETPTIPDRRLQRSLETAVARTLYQRLGSLPNLSDLVSIHVHRGTVTLKGRLPSLLLQQDVFDVVADTTGVREIDDRIKLGSSPALVSVWPTDFGTGINGTW